MAVLVIAKMSSARLVREWTDKEMFERADLVVIACNLSTKDSDERIELPDLSPPVSVIGVVTEFRTNLILKGSQNVTRLLLHHYRLDKAADIMIPNGPRLVRIPDGEHKNFLLFLKKEGDGRYIPVTGQADPAGLSVVELVGGAGE